MDYKQLIADSVLANKSRKQTAVDMNMQAKILDQLIARIWPKSLGKWTALRETLGLSPWGHMRNHNPHVPGFRFVKDPQCKSCQREQWRGYPIPLNESGLCLNCAAITTAIGTQEAGPTVAPVSFDKR